MNLSRYFPWGDRSVLTAGVLLQVEPEGMGEGGGPLRQAQGPLEGSA